MTDVMTELRKADWGELYPRLLLFARRLSGRDTVMAEDVVQQAIIKAMDGTRVWDPKRSTLFQFLCGIVQSDISHARMSYYREHTINLEEVDVDNLADHRYDVEPIGPYEVEEIAFLAFLSDNDPKVAEVARLILQEGISRVHEIASRMRLSVSKTEYLKKKLRRLAKAYLPQRSGKQRLVKEVR